MITRHQRAFYQREHRRGFTAGAILGLIIAAIFIALGLAIACHP